MGNYKYTVEAYDKLSTPAYRGSHFTCRHVDITTDAISEKEALAKAKEMVKREVYVVIKIDRG